MEDKKEMVNHPSHYNQGSLECIDGIVGAFGEEEASVFCKINAMKYLWRLGHKDDKAQEVGKIKWYLDKYLELVNRIEELPEVTLEVVSDDNVSTTLDAHELEARLKKEGLTQRQINDILNK